MAKRNSNPDVDPAPAKTLSPEVQVGQVRTPDAKRVAFIEKLTRRIEEPGNWLYQSDYQLLIDCQRLLCEYLATEATARPTCATCKHFHDYGTGQADCRLTSRLVWVDGSGFCHMHQSSEKAVTHG